MRIFKKYKINNKIFQEELFYQTEINSKFKEYQKIFNAYVNNVKFKPNKKSKNKSLDFYDCESNTSSLLILGPTYDKIFSKRYGDDPQHNEILKFEFENIKLISLLEEIALKKVKIVDRTRFDNFEGSIDLELISNCLTELYELLSNNQYLVRKTTEGAIDLVNKNINELRQKLQEEMNVINNMKYSCLIVKR